MEKALETRERIVEIVKQKGPVLPVHISKEIGSDILMASAHLAELTASKRLKISTIKVGGSPLYYLQGQEEMLQKFTFDAAAIKGKHIAVVDDSIMRGTTLPMIVPLLSALGALSVHVRIACPPIKHSCRYGIHTPTDKELISSSKNPDEICKMVGADSLEFLPYEALRDLSATPNNFCYACMNGEYW